MSISSRLVRCLSKGSKRIPDVDEENRMRKLVAIENGTLDGMADSREGLGFEWANMLDNPHGNPGERAHAEWVHDVDKAVFSTTLESATWANSRLISGNIAET